MKRSLLIDPEESFNKIEAFINKKIRELKRDGALLGFSGGLDSSVTAAILCKCLGSGNVHLISMPERDSKNIHQRHADRYARELGCKYLVMPITTALRAIGTYQNLPIGCVPFMWLRKKLFEFGREQFLENRERGELYARHSASSQSWTAKGNAYAMAKHRMRTVVAYQYAEVNNLMVVGAANRTEWLTGTFSKWGIDHCADIMPVLHLFRTQVEKLAEYIGLPEYIKDKAADPDILPGLENKEKLLGDFEKVDGILFDIDQGLSKAELVIKHDRRLVKKIWELYQLTTHMRNSPYVVE